MKITIRISVYLIGITLLMNLPALAASEAEQLIVFLQPGVSDVDDAFQNEGLADIQKLADQMGVRVYSVDATKGAPEEIALTPLLVYQNHRGRSIYQGRTNTPKRIQNFIRTSRYVPQGKAQNLREQIPVWQNGRTRTWAPLKVSRVTGSPPANYSHDAFIANALKHINKGFKKFRLQKAVQLGRADRGFYMDFYPWLSDDGTLFLTVAVFSQFYCHAPVTQDKIIGPWKDRKKLFRKAGELAEKIVAGIINNPQSGDSFSPIKKNIPKISWEKLGFDLPAAPAKKATVTSAQLKLPREWVLIPSGPADPPMIQFRFPAPLDNYAGEVTSGKGELIFPANLHPNGATGYIEVNTGNSITMGDPVLDEAIRGSIMLHTKAHPTSKFIIEAVSSEDRPIAFGQQTATQIRGQFTLKGRTVPLTSMAEIEPIIADDGKPNLLIRSTFEIDLRTFKIEGADGPAPARHTLLFDANFRLKGK